MCDLLPRRRGRAVAEIREKVDTIEGGGCVEPDLRQDGGQQIGELRRPRVAAAGVGGAEPSTAWMPLVVGLLAAFVAYGRRRLAPRPGSSRPAAVQTTY